MNVGADEQFALVETIMHVFFKDVISSLELLRWPSVHRCTSGSLGCRSCLVFLWSEACMHESMSVLIQQKRKRHDSKSLPVLTSSPSWMASDCWNGELVHAQNTHEVCYCSGSFKPWSCGMNTRPLIRGGCCWHRGSALSCVTVAIYCRRWCIGAGFVKHVPSLSYSACSQ